MTRLRKVSTATLAVTAATLAALAAVPLNAAPAKLVAGTLTCNSPGTVGWIVGSKEDFECDFNLVGKGRHEPYSATITKVGLDIGVKGPSVLVWTVLSSTNTPPRGALVGDYAGLSAEAAVGIGIGANALVGGSDRSVVLQPLSVEGQEGLNLAIGVSGLSLRRM